jgi:hypothetical protein
MSVLVLVAWPVAALLAAGIVITRRDARRPGGPGNLLPLTARVLCASLLVSRDLDIHY